MSGTLAAKFRFCILLLSKLRLEKPDNITMLAMVVAVGIQKVL